jgi:hypothetical protein
MLFEYMNDIINEQIIESGEENLEMLKQATRATEYNIGLAKSKWFKLNDIKCLGSDCSGLPGSQSVYIIFHKPENGDDLICVNIGKGKPNKRISDFYNTLLGKDDEYNAALKARLVDSNSLNYYYTYVTVNDSSMAKQLESRLQADFKPLYNKLSSAGL